jgi:CxxC motif-containing protein (DUF1111 family)
MPRFCPAWCLIGAVVIFAPVTWRVLSWQRSEPPIVDIDQAKAGEVLFKHAWEPNDPLCAGGDGLGPVFNAKSCAACHHQNGAGGSGSVEHNVTTFLVLAANGVTPLREGVVHGFATSEKYRETLSLVDPSLPAISQPKVGQIVATAGPRQGGANDVPLTIPTNVRLSQRNTPALFGVGLIDSISDRDIIANERQQRVRHGMAPGDGETLQVGRALRLANGQIGRFGWKAHTAHLSDFVQAACANELGLGNPGHDQPQSMANALYRPPGADLTQQQCDQLTAFVAALPRPVERLPVEPNEKANAVRGKHLFATIGCANCHTPNLGGVEGIYSDLLLHRMGATLEGGSSYYGAPVPTSPTTPTTSSEAARALPDEWRTPPLWGVADSAPYLHDGRATTLEEAIEQHGGQAAGSARQFRDLRSFEQQQVLAFLHTLRAP